MVFWEIKQIIICAATSTSNVFKNVFSFQPSFMSPSMYLYRIPGVRRKKTKINEVKLVH